MNWQDFITTFDSFPSNVANQDKDCQRGLETGKNASKFHIARNGVWSTSNKDGSSTFSYEKLGYHANTSWFMKGVLESDVEIVDHRQ